MARESPFDDDYDLAAGQLADHDEIEIVGRVATLVFTVGSAPRAWEDPELEDRALAAFRDAAPALERQCASLVSERLGSEFDVEDVEIRPRQSFSISIAIAASSAVVIFYGELRSGLQALAGDIGWLIKRALRGLDRPEPDRKLGITGAVVAGPGLYRAIQHGSSRPRAAGEQHVLDLTDALMTLRHDLEEIKRMLREIHERF